MPNLTLAEARQYLHPFVAGGVGVNDPRVISRINEARERLFALTDFKGKKARYQFCAFQNCITLPRDLETALAVRVDQLAHHVRPLWFEYQDNGPGLSDADSMSSSNLIDRGDGWPCYRDICTPTLLRVYADLPEDAGAKLTVLGTDDATGKDVMTSVSGVWQFGEQIGINNATPQTSTKTFRRITGVRKPKTNGPVGLYAVTPGATSTAQTSLLTFDIYTATAASTFITATADWADTDDYSFVFRLVSAGSDYNYDIYDEDANGVGSGSVANTGGTITFNGHSIEVDFLSTPSGQYLFRLVQSTTSDTLSQLALFHPDDTNPTYRRYYIPGVETHPSAEDGVPVSAICQRRYVPIRRDNDLVFPSNIAALKNMLMAIEFEARGNLNAAAAHEAKAVGYLRKELKQYYGAGQVATLNIQMGGARFSQLR